MSVRTLLIDKENKKQIQEVIDYAEQNVLTREMLNLLQKGEIKPPGDNPNYVVLLPTDFKVVYTIEQHPSGTARHISITVDTPGKYPNEFAVDMIIKEFGFRGTYRDCYTWLEDDVEALNLLQFLEEDFLKSKE